MATFAAWLSTQQDRQDDTGKLARAWAADQGKGTIRSPEGMKRYIRENWPEDEADYWVAAIAAAQQRYDGEREASRSLSADEEQNWREQLDGQPQDQAGQLDPGLEVWESASGEVARAAGGMPPGAFAHPGSAEVMLLRAAGTRLDAVEAEQVRAGHDLDVIKSRLAWLVAGLSFLLPDAVVDDLSPYLDAGLRAGPEDAELTAMAVAADFSGP